MHNISSNFSRRRYPLVAAMLAIGAACLCGCTAAQQTAATTGIATVCGVASDVAASGAKLNANQSAALSVATVACSNPLSISGIASDVASAILTLAPIVTAALKANALTPAQASSATALIDNLPAIRRIAKGEPIEVEVSRIAATPRLHVR